MSDVRQQLEEWVQEFLEYLARNRGYSPATVETYEQSLEQALAHCRLEHKAEGLLLDLMPLRRTIASNSKKTVARKLSALRSWARYLREQRGIALRLRGDDPVKVPQTLPKPVEERYIREVLDEAGIEERTILALLYGLGLRISELATLRREQIGSEWVTVHGKGGKSRQLPLLPEIRQLLDDYYRYAPSGRYLFEKGGVPLNAAQLRYRIQKLFKARGIRVTPHQLRHSFASHLLNRGARISDVSELLGHSSMATTQIYTRLENRKKLEEYRKAHPLLRSED